MFAIVEEAIAGATHALLTGDRERARALVANDVALDDLYVELQELVHDRVVAGGLAPAETTWLLSVLSMIPELERSGDLAEHVAESLGKGDRVVATGRLEHETWTGRDGEERTTDELVCDDLGASLRYATGALARTVRRSPDETGADGEEHDDDPS